MNPDDAPQELLISYIAPAAPATRRPADGDEPYLRPEIGFGPAWYREALGIDFGHRWHTDVDYRLETVDAMRGELRRRFGGTRMGSIDSPDSPRDLLTGTFGAAAIAGIYGLEVLYSPDKWPNVAHDYLDRERADALEPPDLDDNPFFADLMGQLDRIEELEGSIEGFVNWQGVLNNAYRLRGEDLFVDMIEAPGRARRLFECVAATMIDAMQRVHDRQRESGVDIRFSTVSNCLVNMVSAEQYQQYLLPLDAHIARAFETIGIHNCAWRADPYLELCGELDAEYMS